MTSHLTKEDVQRLLQEPSSSVRAEVAGKLALDIDNPALSESETMLAQEVVRLMAKDVESTVRIALSQNLRRAVRLPHDIAVQLANDIESVALPILRMCRFSSAFIRFRSITMRAASHSPRSSRAE